MVAYEILGIIWSAQPNRILNYDKFIKIVTNSIFVNYCGWNGRVMLEDDIFFLRNFDGFVIRDTEYYSSVIISLLGVNFLFLVVICDKFAAGKP